MSYNRLIFRKITDLRFLIMPTVLITGASSGIGKALALVYASHQHALLLTGRDEDALNQVAQKCRQYSVEVFIYAKDLCLPDAVQSLMKFIEEKQLKIDLLINNAGAGCYRNFSEIPFNSLEQMLRVNIDGLVKLTRQLLPSMIKQGKGSIVNIGSVYSFVPVASQAVYAASKAFVKSFSLGLQAELKKTGVSVSCVFPGSTESAFRARAGVVSDSKRFTLPSTIVAYKIYQGVKRKRLFIIPGWYNWLFVFLIQYVPIFWLPKIINFLAYRMRRIEKKPSN
ncbi:SDR family NAD(P)-dependent oxidoreductase [Coxiella burnetii]|uniref:Short chain dehydrogenase n=1 Tax=Coxiella burnetii (strain RSA 493 / Nine Mile phase I) TaxID=227377 RepID=Q83D17_COXBU|nr:SDR family oxidoreductase [Coxiella burnetii]NP_819942.1 short chain dehydrogenase [Coxiella burnetii RSA 493]AAO90456.1 short chain dehydrogenase [Coxiella burnetii RSA 493]ARI65756.1 short-chain dehydrogenase [Coxiella burnetii]ARK27232.1 short-chain dehydrogenase [Coxiella burnetii]ATN74350.1 short-chain dehydrogenase [Coxiella burnetii]ATN76254.1 short-chain dehydrogenase [Coxiella burnetii]